ncbi:DUF3784 domain-containing protein [Bacillus aquiflavi]|uniref:DUF3784 domain-containing protein n=1 Tax=Bacillus aquiflavi TaxID=2672567 RepID=A0A6B3VY18_9BACI|nr:DUF3784 domain-containing protein [Bacillus aquiflavi]MBA4536840.1 DUF3784 domain-containing protein [Bacillus aquiflavi]NEY81207.1 DUF3784 domain-containing protein [Bacillus aquiflavi]UAC48482.1 DUF3784 domain-containing protein [Bacillus aquiflavi]
MLLAGVIVCTFVSILLIFLGCFIWKKKKLSLIGGFDDQTFKGDKNKLAKLFGVFSILVGVLTFILPFGLEFAGTNAGIIYMVLVVVGIIFVLIYANKLNRSTFE